MPYSIFDIAGPIMVGPSSSHTAGAVKIGQLARAIFDETPKKATFYLHGSFGTVYKGHATDKALLAGLMKFKTSDSRIKDAFKIALKKGIKYSFIVTDLGLKYHPNTVKIVLEADNRKIEIVGSSLGGGVVMICEINGFPVDIRAVAGKYKSVVISHKDDPTLIGQIMKKFTFMGFRIIDTQSNRVNGHCLTVFNLDGREFTLSEVLDLEKTEGVEFIRSLHKIVH